MYTRVHTVVGTGCTRTTAGPGHRWPNEPTRRKTREKCIRKLFFNKRKKFIEKFQ